MQRFFSSFSASFLILSSITIFGQSVHAQTATPDRITQVIDNTKLTTLKGNVSPLARTQYDLGSASPSLAMSHVNLLLQRSASQEAALETYLVSVQDKGSSNYHKWLTPAQFGKLYGPSDGDVQQVTAWLQSRGFTINQVAAGRTFIVFSGSVAQVQEAFHTTIHSYNAKGVAFVSNLSDPKIPAALAGVVGGVAHLNTVPLKPLHVRRGPTKFDSQLHRFLPVSGKSGVHTEYTVTEDGGSTLVTVPADAATIYDTPNTFNAKFGGGTAYTGTGATIGIAGQSSIDPTIVQNFRNLFVGDTKSPVISNLDNVGDVSGDDDESYLDNEIAGGLAPGATIHFYTESATTDNGVIGAAQYAIDTDNTVDILSLSYGSCELENTTSGNQQINALWQQAAAQGITVIVSTGDTGSAGCDPAEDSEGNNTVNATGPLAVNGLASTPYDIAVGGTDFDALYPANGDNDFSTYVSTGSAGSATTFYRTALGYIPEATWNDSTLNNTTVSDNVPLSEASNQEVAEEASISAGSGGPSNCSTNTTTSTLGTCTSGYPKPSWQTGAGVPNDQARDVPDVSFLSGTGFYGANWAVCDNSTNGFDSGGNTGTANCIANSSGDFYTDAFGGTSAATPTFAGIMALVVQKTGQRQGAAAPILYSLFNSTPSVFHDVTLGNNSVPCSPTTTTTATCLENSQSYDYESGFNSNAGYDLATGLGSVDATLLVNNWTSASGSLSVASVAATPSATTITTTEPLTFTVNVTPLTAGGATPAGTVTATDGVYTSTVATLSGGSATITIPANSLTANAADTFTITYAPTSGTGFANASTFVAIAITQGVAPGFAISGSSITVAPGALSSAIVSVAPSGGFTGAVSLTCSITGPAGAASIPTCSLTPAAVTIVGTTTSTTTLNLTTTAATTAGAYTATVSGVGAGNVAGTGTIPVTVASTTTPTLALAGAAIAIAEPGQSGTSAIAVTPGGGFTGAVGLTCTVTGPTGANSVPTCALNPTSVIIAGVAVQASTLTVTTESTTSTGSYIATVNAADTATGKVTASVGVAVTVSGTTAAETIVFGTPTAATVSAAGQSATSTIGVTTNYSPAKINFSCTLATAPSSANASYNPACSVAAVTIAAGSTTGTATATFTTTASTTGTLAFPKTNHKPENRWYAAGGGAALACILFFGIPARRRGWRAMLALLFFASIAGIGCGGGSNNSNNTSTGTTSGTYTFTVVGTDSVTTTITSTGTITLTVN